MDNNEYLDRQIIIAMIVSNDYLQAISPVFNPRYLEDATARRLASWCLDYYKQFNKAPGKSIKDVFYEAVNDGLPEDLAEEIEEDVLPGLSEEFTNIDIDIPFLIKRSLKHFNKLKLLQYAEEVKNLVENGELKEAEKKAKQFTPLITDIKNENVLSLGSEDAEKALIESFKDSEDYVVKFPRQLGEFINHQFIKSAFIAFLAPEKRGKTFLMMDIALTAVRQGKRVAFFQAGDMSEKQQVKRIGVYLAGKSNLQKYCGQMFEPIRDCIHNQRDTCTKPERECDFGIFEGKSIDQLRKELTIDELKEALQEYPDYKPCWNCEEYFHNKWGVPWIKSIDVGSALTEQEALKAWRRFFKKYDKRNNKFKLISYPNSTLSVDLIETYLDAWEKEAWFPDLIVVDYADILVWNGGGKEFRHSQNEIWKALRAITQNRNQPCLVTATQADADSYSRNRLGLKNFNEDKRKYGHVTAMYGINQDKDGREKRIGIIALNELVIREGEFDTSNEIYILQNLRRGRPRLSSYW